MVTLQGLDKMTEEIFRRDGYMSEFESRVVAKDGDLIELESTAFYPGGGGQVCDTGTIRGEAVTEVVRRGGSILHLVPGNTLNVGDAVWCGVDWDRRYDLMQGHTGEHLLFASLKRQVPDLGIVKIHISPEDKHVVVDRDIGWEEVLEAVAFANRAIRENLPVTRSLMDRDDPGIADVRVRLDRVDDEYISVVSIGDIDLSACSGIHVMETSELEFLLVDRKASAGRDGTAIHFKVGDAAKDAALGLAGTCLLAAAAVGSDPDLLAAAVANMERRLASDAEAIRAMSRRELMALEPETVGDLDICSGVFHADRRTLTEAAERCKAGGGTALLVSSYDGVFAIVASADPRIICNELLPEVLKAFGGKGGGRPDFAQGGIDDPSQAGALLESLRDAVISAYKP
jgi:alanyl-tRNA synthetase